MTTTTCPTGICKPARNRALGCRVLEREREREGERERDQLVGVGEADGRAIKYIQTINTTNTQASISGPLSSERGTNTPGKARFWPWRELVSVRTSRQPFKLQTRSGVSLDYSSSPRPESGLGFRYTWFEPFKLYFFFLITLKPRVE